MATLTILIRNAIEIDETDRMAISQCVREYYWREFMNYLQKHDVPVNKTYEESLDFAKRKGLTIMAKTPYVSMDNGRYAVNIQFTFAVSKGGEN